MMLRRLILPALLLTGPVPALAQSRGTADAGPECAVRMNATPAAWMIRGYDPYDSGVPEGTFSVTFTNEGTAECRFVPMFVLDQPPFGLSSGAGKPVGYALLNITDSQDVTPRPGRGNPSPGTHRSLVLGAGQSRTVLYKLVAAADDVSNAGTFTEDLTLEAQDASFRLIGGTHVVVGLEVLPSARIGLAGAYTMNNGHAVVSLGELREGPAQVPLQLRVSSTGRYDLDVASINGGRLRLGASDWEIPYSMTIGGNEVDLAGTDTVSGPGSDGLTRSALPIHFLIGDVANKRAGTYSDLISISVSAR